MSQRLNYAIFGALLLGIACQSRMDGQAAPVPPTQKQFRIYLTASNSDGSLAVPVQADLSAKIDKQPVQITSLRPAKEDPLLFALLIDTSTSQRRDAKSIENVARMIFQSLSTGENKGYLGGFDVTMRLSREPLSNSDAQRALNGIKFGGGTSLYDAIAQTCAQALSRPKNPGFPRRLIVLLSDGDDDQSRINRAKTEAIALQEGVAIFSLTTEDIDRQGERFLKGSSKNTGGQAIFVKRLEDGVAPLLDAISKQWALEFAIPETLDEKSHTMSIEDAQQGVQISAPALILFP
jgi:hypothetical protein